MGIDGRLLTNNAHKNMYTSTFRQNQASSKADFFKLIITL